MSDINTEKFPHRLTEAIEASGESIRSIAKKVQVSPASISRYANGILSPKIPTVYSLAEHLGVNPLWLMGASDEKGKHRQKRSVLIPVLGVVRAGLPMDAVEYIIDYEEISEEMARQGEFFALQIKGDSMEPRIKEGDVVIVRKLPDVESGDIAIVLVNGDDATIKKVQKFDGGINLIPSNSAYNVLTYSNAQIESLPVQILGKVVELRAKF